MAQLLLLGGEVKVARDRESRLQNNRLIVILDQACLQLVHTGHGHHALLTSDTDPRILRKAEIDESAKNDWRPDITFQCLQALIKSPLNKLGLLQIFIRTLFNELIEINPQMQCPRTYTEFSSIVGTLLIQKKIRAKDVNVTLMRVIKNDLGAHLPPDCARIGLEVTGPLEPDLVKFFARHTGRQSHRGVGVDAGGGCREPVGVAGGAVDAISGALKGYQWISDVAEHQYGRLTARGRPCAVFIGAVAHGSPAAKARNPLVEEEIRISSCNLTAAQCCHAVCDAFERMWVE